MSPIQISDLDPATNITPNSDLVIVRQGLVDKKATVAQISAINFASYTISATPLLATDVLLIGRNDGLGGYNNYAINPQQLGFLPGTRMWFYTNTAPQGWQIVAGTGDRILGTVLAGGGTNTYNATGLQGTWQQGDVNGVPGQGLTITQIPNHNHWSQFGHTVTEQQAFYMSGTKSLNNPENPRYGQNAIRGIVNGAGDNAAHNNFGPCDPHNHGASWRPAANVGIICEKIA